MKMSIFILGSLILTSCAMPKRVEPVKKEFVPSQSDRIMKCVDKYRGEGLKKAYEICKDLHTLDQ